MIFSKGSLYMMDENINKTDLFCKSIHFLCNKQQKNNIVVG